MEASTTVVEGSSFELSSLQSQSDPRHGSPSTGSTRTTHSTGHEQHRRSSGSRAGHRPSRDNPPAVDDTNEPITPTSGTLSIIRNKWSSFKLPTFFGSLSKDVIALAGLIVTLYFGWRSLVIAKEGLELERIQTCQNEEVSCTTLRSP